MKFTYAVTINALPAYDDKQYLKTLTGEVEAENYGQAKEQAQSLAWDHCKQLEQERGIIVGYENVRLIWQKATQGASNRSAEQIIQLLYRHLEQAKTNEQRSIQIHKQTKGRGKALTRSAVDRCSGRTMALQVLLNEIELGTGASESHASENPEQRAIVLYDPPRWIDPSPTRPLTQEVEQ